MCKEHHVLTGFWVSYYSACLFSEKTSSQMLTPSNALRQNTRSTNSIMFFPSLVFNSEIYSEERVSCQKVTAKLSRFCNALRLMTFSCLYFIYMG